MKETQESNHEQRSLKKEYLPYFWLFEVHFSSLHILANKDQRQKGQTVNRKGREGEGGRLTDMYMSYFYFL